ncbi:MAG: caspase family protein, partial [Cyanobacteria bacterium P01_A01_bin.135]
MSKLALLIGVSDYGDGFEPLTAPVKDVVALQHVLEDQELGGFEVATLENPNPTEMRLAIERL